VSSRSSASARRARAKKARTVNPPSDESRDLHRGAFAPGVCSSLSPLCEGRRGRLTPRLAKQICVWLRPTGNPRAADPGLSSQLRSRLPRSSAGDYETEPAASPGPILHAKDGSARRAGWGRKVIVPCVAKDPPGTKRPSASPARAPLSSPSPDGSTTPLTEKRRQQDTRAVMGWAFEKRFSRISARFGVPTVGIEPPPPAHPSRRRFAPPQSLTQNARSVFTPRRHPREGGDPEPQTPEPVVPGSPPSRGRRQSL
jgi:hypothetical protein